MTKHTIMAWVTFSTKEEAHQAIERLTSGGFARNSINLDHRPDGDWSVGVHTKPHNARRVESLLRAPSPMYAVQRTSAGALESVLSNPVVLAGAAVLAGAIIYSLLPSNRRSVVRSVRRFPSRVREAVESMPSTMREAAANVQETASDLSSKAQDMIAAATGGETRGS